MRHLHLGPGGWRGFTVNIRIYNAFIDLSLARNKSSEGPLKWLADDQRHQRR
jgi:hypothetical protein